MTPNEMEARPKQEVGKESTRPGRYFIPPVDIIESTEALVLTADMPGVGPDGVDVRLDGDQLTIEGRIGTVAYDGLKPLHVEYVVGGYRRTFTLGETIDREGIKASMRNGVLTVELPKASQARVRKIAVQAA